MHSTRTAGISSIIVVLIGAVAIGAGALMSSNQAQSPGDALVDSSTTTASSSVAISVEEEGVKRTVRGKEEANISSDPLDEDDDGDTAPGAESDSSSLVTYTADGFSPQTLEVSVGTMVRFKNASGGEMWITSNNTAGDENCPDTEGDNFDQCEVGEEFSFTFNSPGEFSYYNQQNLEHTGTIVVTEE